MKYETQESMLRMMSRMHEAEYAQMGIIDKTILLLKKSFFIILFIFFNQEVSG